MKLRWFLLMTAILLLLAGQVMARQTGTTARLGYIGQSDSDMARGIQLAIDEINAAGGITGPGNSVYFLELVTAEADTAEAVPTAIESLTSQGVVAIFGPDSNALALPNAATLSSASVPILTAATDETLLNQDTNANIFRLVAPQSVYDTALANYLVSVRGVNTLVVIQSSADWNASVITFSTVLNQLSTLPLRSIQVTEREQLLNQIEVIPGLNPQATVMFGSPDDVVAVLEQLREAGWTGVFAYRTGGELDVDPSVVGTVVTVDSWSFGANNDLGSRFIANYVGQYAGVPGPLAAAGYDGVYALRQVIRLNGATALSLRQQLPSLGRLSLVRGPVDLISFGNRVFSRTAMVYELTAAGGQQVQAAYDNGVLRDEFGETTTVTISTPTPTLRPTATITPIPTATATPNVLVGTVNSQALNVRSGPSTDYPRQFQLQNGDQVVVIGRNNDYTWLYIQSGGRVGWVFAQYLDLFDPGGYLVSLPVIQAPATPTPAPTQRPQQADLVITNVSLSPASPQPGTPVTATITISNLGLTDAGPFAVATSFMPGDLYSANNLSGLAAGATVTTTLTTTFTQTGYVPDLAFVVDLNEQVPEGQAGEANNIYELAYKVDRPVAVLAQVTFSPAMSFDFYGGAIDISWDGVTLTMSANGAIGPVIGNQTFEQTHYDQVPSFATSSSVSNPPQGASYAVITEEGQYGFIRIDSRSGSNVTLTYRIYAP